MSNEYERVEAAERADTQAEAERNRLREERDDALHAERAIARRCRTAEAERDRLRAECAVCEKCGHVQAEPNWCHECGHRVTVPEWAKPLLDAWAERDRLREALEFYADPLTYFALGFHADPPCGDFMEDGEEIDGAWRPGKRARKALRGSL